MTDDKHKRRPYRHYPDWYKEIRDKCKHRNIWIITDSIYDQPREVLDYYIKLFNERYTQYKKALQEMFPDNNVNSIVVDCVSDTPLGLSLHEIRTLIGMIKGIEGHYAEEEEKRKAEEDLYAKSRMEIPISDKLASGIDLAEYNEKDRVFHEELYDDVDTMEQLNEDFDKSEVRRKDIRKVNYRDWKYW